MIILHYENSNNPEELNRKREELKRAGIAHIAGLCHRLNRFYLIIW
jgi:hypothetical protein